MQAFDDISAELERLHQQHAAEHAELVERQAKERAAVLERARSAGTAQAPSSSSLEGIPDDLLRPKEAQRAFKLSKSVLFRLGANYPTSVPGGFCFVDGRGVQLFSKGLLEAFLAAHPRRRQRR